MSTEPIKVYCDGSCPRPYGPGGWAFVILMEAHGQPNVYGRGAADKTTNQRMELLAGLNAMRRLAKLSLCDEPIVIISDSMYLVKGMMRYRFRWREEDFFCIKNERLWRKLDRRADGFEDLRFEWVKGHANNYWNEYVDRAAAQARRREQY